MLPDTIGNHLQPSGHLDPRPEQLHPADITAIRATELLPRATLNFADALYDSSTALYGAVLY
eukprot:3938197-Rhodomonas_salina.1